MITIEGVDPKMIANNLKPYKPIHPGEVPPPCWLCRTSTTC